MKKFNYKGLVFFSTGMIFLTLINPVAAQAAASPTAKITSELKGYYAKTISRFKVNPSRVIITNVENPDYSSVITRDSLGNSSIIAKDYHYTDVNGFIYSDDAILRSTLALKVAKRLGLDTSATLSKITNSYWSPEEVDFKRWASPFSNNAVNNELLSETNLDIIPEILNLYIDSLKYSKGASMKLSSKGGTRTYSWGYDQNKFALDGKVTMVVEKGVIAQFTLQSVEKKSYKLVQRYKFEFKNYPVSIPKGPYLEYDEILGDAEFTDELYENTAREAFSSVWDLILSDALIHANLGDGLYVTVGDINLRVSGFNSPDYKFTQYSQAIESFFKSVKGDLIYVCSILPQDIMATDLFNAAKSNRWQIPFSITYQRCSELGYTLSNQGA
jgi:hypothetical protein